MPAVVLSLIQTASWSRYMRSSMLEVLKQDYVRTARAKGVVERLVITKHAVRNALIPIVTVVVLSIPTLFNGAVITETIFAWNGMGRLFINALTRGDYPRHDDVPPDQRRPRRLRQLAGRHRVHVYRSADSLFLIARWR